MNFLIKLQERFSAKPVNHKEVDFPDELYLLIFSFLELTDFTAVMLTCKRWNDVINDTLIWRQLSRRYKNYPGFTSECHSKNEFKEKYFSPIMIEDIIIGEVSNPEKKHKLILYGNGKCTIDNVAIHEKMSPLFSKSPSGIKSYVPFTDDHHLRKKNLSRQHELSQTRYSIIRIYRSIILFLSIDGDVYECVIAPSWMNEYEKILVPEKISVPPVKNIFITKVGNFACGDYVYYWICFSEKLYGPVQLPLVGVSDIIDDEREVKINFIKPDEVVSVGYIELAMLLTG